MSVVIRSASPSDAIELVELIKEHATYERAELNLKGLALRLTEAMEVNTPKLDMFVAEIDNALVGYCSLTREFSTWAAQDYLHMDCLFVRREMRGQRLGKSLFDRAIKFAKKVKIDQMQWQTPGWNHSAIGFYQSIGATPISKQRFEYRVTE